MAREPQYAAEPGSNNKRKYESDQTTPSPGPRRPTGFSAPISNLSPPDAAAAPPSSYNNVPPPMDDFQLAKQKAQEIAARLLNSAEAKKPRVGDNGSGLGAGTGFDSCEHKPIATPSVTSPNKNADKPIATPPVTSSYDYSGQSKKIKIPYEKVDNIVGKGGWTFKQLKLESGAKIELMVDLDADLDSPSRGVELTGTPDQIAKAEQLITEALSEQSGAEQFSMKVPNNKVGLVIGKGGETIKDMQTKTGARIQVIPPHLPPGDTSTERTVQIDGSSVQIEAAKQQIYAVIGNNHGRNPGMDRGYSQQGYQALHPTNWAPQPGYGYGQPGAYPGQAPQYNGSQQAYPGYTPQPASARYGSGWNQSAALNQQYQASGYGYYVQQAPPQQQQTPGSSAAAGYSQGQAYSQDGYGGYHTPAPHSGCQGGYQQQQGYGSTAVYGNASNPASEGHSSSYGIQAYSQDGNGGYHAPGPQSGYQGGYELQQGYGFTAGYGSASNSSSERHSSSYGTQGDGSQAPPPVPASGQQGYPAGLLPSPYYAQADSSAPAAQPGYGAPPYGDALRSYGQQQPPPYNSTYGAPPYRAAPL